MIKEKDFFEYQDYRQLIRSFLLHQPKKGRGLLRAWAEKLQIHTTLMSQIMAGLRELSEDHALLLSQLMGFPKLEQEYFLTLIRFQKASTEALRVYLKKQLQEIRDKSKQITHRVAAEHKLTDHQRAIFYSSWIYAAIGLNCSIGNGLTLEELEKKFELPKVELQKILEFMLEAHLLHYKNNRYIIGSQSVHLEKDSPFLIRHHTNWRFHALHRGERLEENELMYTAPFSISQEDMKKLREKLMVVIQEFVEFAKQSPAEEVACFNLDLVYIK